MTDEELAAELADGAGKLLMALRDRSFPDGRSLGRVADKVSNAFILTSLAEWRPDDAILSEESPDCSDRLARERVWIVDPLDGTREYSEGRSDWAVHVALSIGHEPKTGAVSVPARNQLFRSDAVPALSAQERARPVMVVSRTRPPPEAEAVARFLDAEIQPMGSAGAKAMAVVSGDADIYYHSGGQHEWDNCAPAAVALGLGLHASRLDGAPLRYNEADTLVPDLVIARPQFADRILDFCRSGGGHRS